MTHEEDKSISECLTLDVEKGKITVEQASEIKRRLTKLESPLLGWHYAQAHLEVVGYNSITPK